MAVVNSDKHREQQEYVEAHKECVHIFACAITDEDCKRAVELVRSGNAYEAAIGMMMLTGPCAGGRHGD